MTVEVLWKLQTFKVIEGRYYVYTLVCVRLPDGRVVTISLPYPENLVDQAKVVEELKRRRVWP